MIFCWPLAQLCGLTIAGCTLGCRLEFVAVSVEPLEVIGGVVIAGCYVVGLLPGAVTSGVVMVGLTSVTGTLAGVGFQGGPIGG